MAAALLSTLACGSSVEDGDPDVSTWKSGSRLRARVRDAGDGATTWLGWQDTKLGVPCSFSTADDGVVRCLPVEEWLSGSVYVELGYTDAACERPVAVMTISECSRAPEYFTSSVPVRDTSECAFENTPTRREAWRLGDKTAGMLHRLVNGACEPRQAGEGESVFSLERVDAGEFVSATASRHPLTDELELHVLETEDGAREIVSLGDRPRDRSCYPQEVGDDYRCISGVPAYAGFYFADVACSDLVAYAHPCESPEIVERYNQGTCESFYTFHALGEPFEGTVYSDYTSCEPREAAWYDDHAPYRFGEDIGATFPLVEIAAVGSGRARALRVAQTSLSLGQRLRHEATGEECYLYVVDGTTRCMPSSYASTGSVFADANCTEPLVTWSKGTESCVREKPAVALQRETASCGETSMLVALGEDWTGEAYAVGSDGTCAPRTKHEFEAFSLPAGPADPEVFAAVVDRVE